MKTCQFDQKHNFSDTDRPEFKFELIVKDNINYENLTKEAKVAQQFGVIYHIKQLVFATIKHDSDFIFTNFQEKTEGQKLIITVTVTPKVTQTINTAKDSFTPLREYILYQDSISELRESLKQIFNYFSTCELENIKVLSKLEEDK